MYILFNFLKEFCSSFDRFPFSPFTLSLFPFLCQIFLIFYININFYICIYIYIGIFRIRAHTSSYAGIQRHKFSAFLWCFCYILAIFLSKNPSFFRLFRFPSVFFGFFRFQNITICIFGIAWYIISTKSSNGIFGINIIKQSGFRTITALNPFLRLP